ncbi:MAG: histidine kinase [Frankiales bacterium]|nr:histidine kinase [Frankiales bacterium]
MNVVAPVGRRAPSGTTPTLTPASRRKAPPPAPAPVPTGARVPRTVGIVASTLTRASATLRTAGTGTAAVSKLAKELCQVLGGTRALVLVLDEKGAVTGRGGHALPGSGWTGELGDLAAEPLLRKLLEGGDIRLVAPCTSVPLGPRTRSAFRAGRPLLLLPLPCGVPADEAVGVAVVEGPLGLAHDVGRDQQLRQLSGVLALVAGASALGEADATRATAEAQGWLAADLHDGVLQQLFCLQLKLRNLGDTLPESSPARAGFDAVVRDVEATSLELRRAVVGLTLHGDVPRRGPRQASASLPPPGSALGEGGRLHPQGARLDAEIEAMLADFQEATGCAFDFLVRGDDLGTPSPTAAALISRTVREGLTNISKHADATQVVLSLGRGAGWWTVDLHDDGLADANVLRRRLTQRTGGFGLASLRTQAADLGGRLWVGQSTTLTGVHLSVAIPVDSPSGDAPGVAG